MVVAIADLFLATLAVSVGKQSHMDVGSDVGKKKAAQFLFHILHNIVN